MHRWLSCRVDEIETEYHLVHRPSPVVRRAVRETVFALEEFVPQLLSYDSGSRLLTVVQDLWMTDLEISFATLSGPTTARRIDDYSIDLESMVVRHTGEVQLYEDGGARAGTVVVRGRGEFRWIDPLPLAG